MCMDVCGVDYLEHGRAEWKTQDGDFVGFQPRRYRDTPRPIGRALRSWRRAGVLRWSITCCRSL